MANVNIGKVLLLCLASMKQAETAENNGCFTFPGLPPSLSLTAMENETITIPFQLRRNSVCFENGEETKSIYISRLTKTYATGPDICLLIVETGGVCRVLNNEDHCQCPGDGNPNFMFTTTVTRGDHGTWTWRVGNDQSHWTEVIIDVQRKDNEVQNEESTVSINDGNRSKKEGSDEGGVPGGLATFGGVFVGVNVVTAIAVGTIVYVVRGRRERKRRNSGSALPPPAKKTAGRETIPQAEPVAMDTPTDSYMNIPGIPETGKYEQTAATFGAIGNNDYENAGIKGRLQVTNSEYGTVF